MVLYNPDTDEELTAEDLEEFQEAFAKSDKVVGIHFKSPTCKGSICGGLQLDDPFDPTLLEEQGTWFESHDDSEKWIGCTARKLKDGTHLVWLTGEGLDQAGFEVRLRAN